MSDAVAFLTEKNAKVPQQDETTYFQTSQVASDRYISVGSQADTSEQLPLAFVSCSTVEVVTVKSSRVRLSVYEDVCFSCRCN